MITMYKFDPTSQSTDEAFRAIALSQLDEALGDLDKGDADGRSIVHEARRRCKKLRALLRLVRPVFAGFATENAAIRDAAALLSHLRDAEVLQHTVKDLAEWRKSEALDRIGQKLADAHEAIQQSRLGEFRMHLAAVRERVPGWTLRKSGRDAVLPGLRLTYRQARERMDKAGRSHNPADFHEWRKANKYHGFHLDLLKKVAPDLLVADLEVVDRLSTLLGLHHDLAVLSEAVAQDPGRFGEPADLDELREAIAARTAETETAAFGLGRQVLAETPRAIARRFAAYWKDAA
jgi:hypothetical protein